MLNIAGPEYDFAQVVFTVLQECEHRRRSLAGDSDGSELMQIARQKLAEIKKAYDEFGGSASYWEALQREVLETAMPQYIPTALRMNDSERNGFNLFRQGDITARGVYALAGLLIGSIIIAAPFIPIVEDMFAFALTGAGFFYPDIVRYAAERRHAKVLNGLIAAAGQYQLNAKLHYMSTDAIRESFLPAGARRELGTHEDQ